MAVIDIDGDTLEIPDNSPLREPCAELGVPFGCKQGQCATCVIEILEGMENLHPRTEPEIAMGLQAHERLACQARIKGGTVRATW